MAKPARNIGASVRARLAVLAKEQNEPLQLLLTRYVLERLLYRLSLSPYRNRFVLKGAMLAATWFHDPYRATRDIDLLGFGDPDPAAMLNVFREICAVPINDGVAFDTTAFKADPTRDHLEYGGVRIRTKAELGGARIGVIVDIGFGDAVEPRIEEIELPVLLDLRQPKLRAYPRETVIAEKFHAMVHLGRVNSRMKDYYDIWMLSRSYEFPGDRLARAIAATFARRRTDIPTDLPDGLSASFASDSVKLQQWATFLGDIAAPPAALPEVTACLAAFLIPHVARAQKLALEFRPSDNET